MNTLCEMKCVADAAAAGNGERSGLFKRLRLLGAALVDRGRGSPVPLQGYLTHKKYPPPRTLP